MNERQHYLAVEPHDSDCQCLDCLIDRIERERDEARQDRDYWAAEAQKDYTAIKEVERLRAEVARLREEILSAAETLEVDPGWARGCAKALRAILSQMG